MYEEKIDENCKNKNANYIQFAAKTIFRQKKNIFRIIFAAGKVGKAEG